MDPTLIWEAKNIQIPKQNSNLSLVAFDWVSEWKQQEICVHGDFSDWKPVQLFLVPESAGENRAMIYRRFIPLTPGRYQFKFTVDGEWQHSAFFPTVQVDQYLNNYVLVPSPKIQKVLVVLGHRLNMDGTPNDILQSEVKQAMDYLIRTPDIDSVIFSGGSVSSKYHPSEAKVMYGLAKEFLDVNFPNIRIILEENSKNTFENAYFTNKIIRSLYTREYELYQQISRQAKLLKYENEDLFLHRPVHLVVFTTEFQFVRALRVFEYFCKDNNLVITGGKTPAKSLVHRTDWEEILSLERHFLGELDQKLPEFAQIFASRESLLSAV